MPTSVNSKLWLACAGFPVPGFRLSRIIIIGDPHLKATTTGDFQTKTWWYAGCINPFIQEFWQLPWLPRLLVLNGLSK
jgi:hypothetical protein